jgi:hypothetical protein
VDKCREKTIEESGIMVADSISPLAIPRVSSVSINDKSVLSPIKSNDGSEPPVEVAIENGKQSVFVSLTFEGMVDPNAVPIKRVRIDWGVPQSTTDRVNTENSYEFSFQKQYSYDDLITVIPAQCDITLKYCMVYPKVQIMDNWDWCGGNKVVNGVFKSTAFYGSACDTKIFQDEYTVTTVNPDQYPQGVPWDPLGAIKIQQY